MLRIMTPVSAAGRAGCVEIVAAVVFERKVSLGRRMCDARVPRIAVRRACEGDSCREEWYGEVVLVAPGGSEATAQTVPPPERVGSYVLVRRIGSGGMAEVWLGRHVVSGGVAAVKRLGSRASLSSVRGELLAREAHTIARLS
ncbi:MAG: hypothetical protein F9K40_07900, partial [Kofleriaceae bacterium]